MTSLIHVQYMSCYNGRDRTSEKGLSYVFSLSLPSSKRMHVHIWVFHSSLPRDEAEKPLLLGCKLVHIWVFHSSLPRDEALLLGCKLVHIWVFHSSLPRDEAEKPLLLGYKLVHIWVFHSSLSEETGMKTSFMSKTGETMLRNLPRKQRLGKLPY